MDKKKLWYGVWLLSIILLWIIFLFSQNSEHQGDVINDSAWAIPEFRVMSDIDTTQIDKKIETRKTQLLESSESKTILSDDIYASRIREICGVYDDICQRMVMVDDFTLREVYNFTLITAYLVTQIDAHTLLDVAGIRNTLSSIRFQNSNEDITRGKAWHRNIIINTYDMRDIIELFEIVTHELMHVFDLWVLVDHSWEKSTTYKEFGKKSFGINDRSLRFYSISREDQTRKRNSFTHSHTISHYSQTNTFEEFAEFGNAWINHHVPLLAMAREDPILLKKYLLFRELFGERHANPDIETYRIKDLNQRPYDTTRRHDTTDDLETPRIIQNYWPSQK